MKLAVYQPMTKPILHTKFHQNCTMGLRAAPGLNIMESQGSDPFDAMYVLIFFVDDHMSQLMLHSEATFYFGESSYCILITLFVSI